MADKLRVRLAIQRSEETDPLRIWWSINARDNLTVADLLARVHEQVPLRRNGRQHAVFLEGAELLGFQRVGDLLQANEEVEIRPLKESELKARRNVGEGDDDESDHEEGGEKHRRQASAKAGDKRRREDSDSEDDDEAEEAESAPKARREILVPQAKRRRGESIAQEDSQRRGTPLSSKRRHLALIKEDPDPSPLQSKGSGKTRAAGSRHIVALVEDTPRSSRKGKSTPSRATPKATPSGSKDKKRKTPPSESETSSDDSDDSGDSSDDEDTRARHSFKNSKKRSSLGKGANGKKAPTRAVKKGTKAGKKMAKASGRDDGSSDSEPDSSTSSSGTDSDSDPHLDVNSDSEMDSNSATDSGTDSVTDSDESSTSDSGSSSASDSGSDSGSDSESGSDAGSDADPRANASTDSDSDLTSDSESSSDSDSEGPEASTSRPVPAKQRPSSSAPNARDAKKTPKTSGEVPRDVPAPSQSTVKKTAAPAKPIPQTVTTSGPHPVAPETATAPRKGSPNQDGRPLTKTQLRNRRRRLAAQSKALQTDSAAPTPKSSTVAPSKPMKPAKPPPATSAAPMGDDIIGLDDWQSRVRYRAVECANGDEDLGEPPFPFVKSWARQGGNQKPAQKERSEERTVPKRGSRRDFDNAYPEEVILSYDEVVETGETSSAPEAEDAPLSEQDFMGLKTIAPGEVVVGTTIAWKEITLSASCMPIIATMTGCITSLSGGGSLVSVKLSKSSLPPKDVGFQGMKAGAWDEEDEDEEDDGMCDLELGGLMELKYVRGPVGQVVDLKDDRKQSSSQTVSREAVASPGVTVAEEATIVMVQGENTVAADVAEAVTKGTIEAAAQDEAMADETAQLETADVGGADAEVPDTDHEVEVASQFDTSMIAREEVDSILQEETHNALRERSRTPWDAVEEFGLPEGDYAGSLAGDVDLSGYVDYNEGIVPDGTYVDSSTLSAREEVIEAAREEAVETARGEAIEAAREEAIEAASNLADQLMSEGSVVVDLRDVETDEDEELSDVPGEEEEAVEGGEEEGGQDEEAETEADGEGGEDEDEEEEDEGGPEVEDEGQPDVSDEGESGVEDEGESGVEDEGESGVEDEGESEIENEGESEADEDEGSENADDEEDAEEDEPEHADEEPFEDSADEDDYTRKMSQWAAAFGTSQFHHPSAPSPDDDDDDYSYDEGHEEAYPAPAAVGAVPAAARRNRLDHHRLADAPSRDSSQSPLPSLDDVIMVMSQEVRGSDGQPLAPFKMVKTEAVGPASSQRAAPSPSIASAWAAAAAVKKEQQLPTPAKAAGVPRTAAVIRALRKRGSSPASAIVVDGSDSADGRPWMRAARRARA